MNSRSQIDFPIDTSCEREYVELSASVSKRLMDLPYHTFYLHVNPLSLKPNIMELGDNKRIENGFHMVTIIGRHYVDTICQHHRDKEAPFLDHF